MTNTPVPELRSATRKLHDRGAAFIRKRGIRFSLLLFVVYIPTALLWIYLTFVHSAMYISESRFALRSSDNAELPAVAGLFFPSASSTGIDAHIVKNHISTIDMMDKVMTRVDWEKHYSDPSRDFISRLKKSPTREELLSYWQSIVTATYDLDKGIITVEVRAYDPETAKAINDAVLACSEDLVNRMNDRAHADALRLTRAEVAAAEQRVLQAQAALRKFRDDNAMLDPAATAKSLQTVIAHLEGEAAGAQAELSAAMQIMQPGSPRVQSLETKLRALQEQITREKTRLAGLNTADMPLSSLIGDYAQLVTEEEFAQKQLVTSMSAFEGARLKAVSQSRYIVPFQPPTLPQESLYPRPLLYTVFGFFVLLTGLGLCSLIVAAVKDHMGV